jgi:hypothetical protein
MYLVLGLWWLLSNWSEALRTRWPLLGAATSALSASVGTDQLMATSSMTLAIEDSCKFLGILAWCLYFTLSVRDIGVSIVTAGPTRQPAPELVDQHG